MELDLGGQLPNLREPHIFTASYIGDDLTAYMPMPYLPLHCIPGPQCAKRLKLGKLAKCG